MSDVAIYTINITCIALMVLLAVILSAATRLKGGAAYVAIIILVCNTSVYLFNMARTTGVYDMAAICKVRGTDPSPMAENRTRKNAAAS